MGRLDSPARQYRHTTVAAIKHIAIIYPPHNWSTLDVAMGYSRAFNRLGYHVIDIHYEQIFEKWYGFFGIKDAETHQAKKDKVYERATADVLAEVVKCQPDIVLVIDGTQVHNLFWDWMDRLCVPTIVVMTDCPYYDETNAYIAERCTFPFANDLYSAEKMGIPYLPVAYSTEIHHPIIVSEDYKSDVVFVGSGFPERVSFLEQVDWIGIDFRLLGYWDLREDSPLQEFFGQQSMIIPNAEVALFYNGAKIVLDLHRTSVDFPGRRQIAGRGSVSPRIYEAAACGAFIIAQGGIGELTELLDGCCLTFHAPNELSALLRTWLRDDMAQARHELGIEARQRIQGHSYAERALEILRAVQA